MATLVSVESATLIVDLYNVAVKLGLISLTVKGELLEFTVNPY